MPDALPPVLSEAQIKAIEEMPCEVERQDPNDESVLARDPEGTLWHIDVAGAASKVDGEPPEPLTLEQVEAAAKAPTQVEIDGEMIDLSDVDAYKPPSTSLEVDAVDPSDVFRAMDRHDEVLILDELAGKAINALVYDFGEGKDRKLDLSVAGVNETVRLMNERGGARIGIANQPPLVNVTQQVVDDERGSEPFYEVMVYSRDERTGTGRWGVAIEPQNMRLKKGGTKWDKFALAKALNKAQRNALRAHIPEEWRQKIIAIAIGGGMTEKLRPIGGGNVAELPPPITGSDADRARAEVSAAYDELKELEGGTSLSLPPARYNAFLTQAQTVSVKRIEEFRDHIHQIVTEVKDRLAEEAKKANES